MLELNTHNFQTEILESSQVSLVYFFSPIACAPCKMLSPIVEKLDAEWKGIVKVGKLNIYPNMPITLKYNVMTAPVLMLFIKGEPVVRLQGYYPREKLLHEFSPYLSIRES